MQCGLVYYLFLIAVMKQISEIRNTKYKCHRITRQIRLESVFVGIGFFGHLTTFQTILVEYDQCSVCMGALSSYHTVYKLLYSAVFACIEFGQYNNQMAEGFFFS